MKRLLRSVSTMLAVSMIFTGCAGKTSDDGAHEIKVKLNETIDADSKWINSSIEGAIDANTPTNPKDDFYTYVNKDFILENVSKLNKDNGMESTFTQGQKAIADRLKFIISGKEDPNAFTTNSVGYDQDEIEHDAELVVKFSGIAGDWEKRNQVGAAPLKEYLEKIDKISSMDEMSEYMASPYEDNFSGTQLIMITNDQTLNDPANNHIIIDVYNDYALRSSGMYFKSGMVTRMMSGAFEKFVTDILLQTGYSKHEAKRMIRNTYKFEALLAEAGRGITEADYKDNENYYTMEETKSLFGNYPIESVIKAYGYENPEGYVIYFPQFAKKLAKLYKPSNLSMIQDFYRVHTVIDMAKLLDRQSFDEYSDCFVGTTTNDSSEGDTKDMETDDKELDILLNEFTYKYMNEPLDAVYVSRYCSKEQKESLTELVEQIIDYYRVMIDEEEWLSQEAKDLTKDKLDAMTLNILYPESYPSYTDVEFADDDTLPNMVAKLRLHNLNQDKLKVGKPHSGEFSSMSTTTMNAYYHMLDNSVNILAGITVPEHMYDLNDPVEVRLAHLGVIVGHEITHGFDDKGIQYDKYGKMNPWWTPKDTLEFATRAQKLKNHYSAIIPIPGGKKYNGGFVSGEAIADLGGVKCMLGIGKGIEGFDYDLFFRSFAQLWRTVDTYDVETTAQSDNHPLTMLRVNVVLQQYDEFYTTYGIEPGDGMYLAPEKRICVW